MTEEVRIWIAFGVMMVISITGYLRMFRKSPSRKQKFIETAKQKDNFATAFLVDTKYRYADRFSEDMRKQEDFCIAVYEYTVNGNTYQKKLRFDALGKNTPAVPRSITIYYDPHHPQKGICPNEATVAHRNSAGCFFTVVGAFFGILCSLLFIEPYIKTR